MVANRPKQIPLAMIATIERTFTELLASQRSQKEKPDLFFYSSHVIFNATGNQACRPHRQASLVDQKACGPGTHYFFQYTGPGPADINALLFARTMSGT